jgi:hypothetical protein
MLSTLIEHYREALERGAIITLTGTRIRIRY